MHPCRHPSSRGEQETGAKGHEFRLRNSLEGLDSYDLALIDCQPSVGELVTNALVAADLALIVTEADVDSLFAITHVMDTIGAVRKYYNPDLVTAGVVVNNLDLRAGEQKFRLDELRVAYDSLVWEPYLPHRTRICDAKGASAPIHDYGYRSKDVAAIFDTIAGRLLNLDKDN